MRQSKKKEIGFIFLTVVLDISGLMVIFPIMPDILQAVGEFSVSDAAIWGGFLYASYALMQFLFSPIIGNISDAFGRRPIILISLFLSSFKRFLYALSAFHSRHKFFSHFSHLLLTPHLRLTFPHPSPNPLINLKLGIGE